MDVSDAKRLGVLEDENARLKRLHADAMLYNAGLKGLMTKKWRRAPSGGTPSRVSRRSNDLKQNLHNDTYVIPYKLELDRVA